MHTIVKPIYSFWIWNRNQWSNGKEYKPRSTRSHKGDTNYITLCCLCLRGTWLYTRASWRTNSFLEIKFFIIIIHFVFFLYFFFAGIAFEWRTRGSLYVYPAILFTGELNYFFRCKCFIRANKNSASFFTMQLTNTVDGFFFTLTEIDIFIATRPPQLLLSYCTATRMYILSWVDHQIQAAL